MFVVLDQIKYGRAFNTYERHGAGKQNSESVVLYLINHRDTTIKISMGRRSQGQT